MQGTSQATRLANIGCQLFLAKSAVVLLIGGNSAWLSTFWPKFSQSQTLNRPSSIHRAADACAKSIATKTLQIYFLRPQHIHHLPIFSLGRSGNLTTPVHYKRHYNHYEAVHATHFVTAATQQHHAPISPQHLFIGWVVFCVDSITPSGRVGTVPCQWPR